jgi:hypothetical protein
MPFELARIGVTLWLIALAVLDVRRRELPHALTTLPLLIVVAVLSVRAFTPTAAGNGDAAAVLLAFVAVLVSDTWLAVLPAFAAIGAAAVLGTDAGRVTVVAWLLALAAAQGGIMGAGDAKVIMLLLIAYPDVRLGVALLAVTGVVGLALMAFLARGATGLWLLSIAQDLLAFKPPARTGEIGRLNLPLVPLLAGGALIYLWGVV